MDRHSSPAFGRPRRDYGGPPPVPGAHPPVPPPMPVDMPPVESPLPPGGCIPPASLRAGSPVDTTAAPWLPEVPTRPLYRPRLFFRTDIPLRWYIPLMGAFSLIPSLILSFALAQTGLLTEDTRPKFEGPPILVFLGMIILSPVIETLLMAAILWAGSFLTGNKTRLAVASAVIWGVLHSLAAPAWGITVAWPFFVFSCVYLGWRDRSVGRALLVAMALHAFHNVLPAVVYLIGAYAGWI